MTSAYPQFSLPRLAILSLFLVGCLASASDPQQLTIDTAAGKIAIAAADSRLGVAEDLGDVVEYSEPEGKLGLTLPGGAHLDVDVAAVEILDEATGEWVEDRTIQLTLPDGTLLSIQMAPPVAAAPDKPKPIRAGIAEDTTDDEEVGDPEGLIKVLFPSGAAITVRTRPTGYRAEKPIKPPRNGIAEDDTDVEEVGDPEGIIAILPGGGTVRLKSQH